MKTSRPKKTLATQPASRKGEDTAAPLKRDIALLSATLDDVIAQCEGQAFLKRLTTARNIAFSAREKPASTLKHEKLAGYLARATPQDQHTIAKALTQLLQLINVAEQAHRMRRRKLYRASEDTPQKSSPDEVFFSLLQAGIRPAQIKRALADMDLELVITAHPTEVMLPDTIRAGRDLSARLLTLDNPAISIDERAQVHADIHAVILRQWNARSIRTERPTPQDEARYGLELTEKILWEAVPVFFRQLRSAYRRRIGSMADLFPRPIRFASWMGGDRDGHPGVTAAVTRDVIALSQQAAQRLYGQKLDLLAERLVFTPEKPGHIKLQNKIAAHLASLRGQLHQGMRRDLFMAGLEALKTDLQKHNLLGLAEKDLQNLIWRVRVFGASLLKLDIRQDAGVHADAVSTFIRGYKEMDEPARLQALSSALARNSIPMPARVPSMTREVLETCRLFSAYPEEFFGTYIISMATQASDLLAVQFLLKAAGVTTPVHICPLFETPDALAAAADIMAQAYDAPVYRKRLQGVQHIMVGYSDSGKRGGYLRALWDIHLLQENLARLGNRKKLRTIIFHGRGGAIARGGGPIESVMAMMPRPLKHPQLRITEQGESINAKFGMPGIAGRTMERYLAGTLAAVFADKTPLPAAWRGCMEQLATASCAAFREKIYEDPDFMRHFSAMTPAGEMSLLKIGSRPGSRTSGGGLESMRAIPWVFSWTQPRLMLPAWLGAAPALQTQIKSTGIKTLQDMYRQWPFFTAIIDMLEMSAALADETIADFYSRSLAGKQDQQKTKAYIDELHLLRRLVVKLKGETSLLARNPVLKHAIAARTPYVDVLNVLQALLIKRHRHHKKPSLLDEETLAITFSGISAGMHNTG